MSVLFMSDPGRGSSTKLDDMLVSGSWNSLGFTESITKTLFAVRTWTLVTQSMAWIELKTRQMLRGLLVRHAAKTDRLQRGQASLEDSSKTTVGAMSLSMLKVARWRKPKVTALHARPGCRVGQEH